MTMPANVGTGKVEGRFIVGVADGPDPDDEPDAIPAQGTITFTASVPYLPNPTSTPSPSTLLKVPIVAHLDSEGYICAPDPADPAKAGARGIRLVATDDPDLSVQGWTWNVTYSFVTVNGVRPQIAAHSIALPTDATVDLTTVVKVPSSTGIGIEQAEALAAAAQAAAAAAAASAAEAVAATDGAVASLVNLGGETTTALDKAYRDGISAAEYGALGDGVTDDAPAIQAAIDAASGVGGTVTIPAGRYRITSTLHLASSTGLRMDGGTVLDVTDLPEGDPAISISGTVDPATALTADATVGTTVVELADTAGIESGDWIKIYSNLVFGATGQPIGEVQRVVSVEGGTVTVDDPLHSTYAVADGAMVERLSMVENVTVTGGRIESTRPDVILHRGIVVDRAHKVSITGVSFWRVHYVGVWMLDSIGVSVSQCTFDEALAAGLGYGVMVTWASQDITITACTATRVRHLVTLGGGTTRAGIVRRVTVTGCTASQSFEAGLDAHPGAEDYTFTGNTVSGSAGDGIVVQGGRFVLAGNIITGSTRHGILVQVCTIAGLAGTISGNTISRSGSGGLLVSPLNNPDYHTWHGFTVSGNTVTDSTSHSLGLVNTLPGVVIEGVAFSGNTIRRGTQHGIFVQGAAGVSVGSNHVAGIPANRESIYIHTSGSASVTGNAVVGGNRGVRVLSSPGTTVTGNRITDAATGILSDAGSAPMIVTGNSLYGSASGLSIGGTGNITSAADADGAYNLLP